ncbi:MAG TPA: ATP-binding protein [Candidatus Sulfotelmatobacter sp.]|nr:ATP-binding protein [Candidatus Sulfotelmatobacter sp.]
MKGDPTLIGTVQDVNGSTVHVELTNETVTGLSFVNGEGYRIGQVGSFVRIPMGFVDLYGVVSQVGAGAAPKQEGNQIPYGNRWLQVQLVGQGSRAGRFERGVSQHPTIEDRVHIVTEADLRAIYGPGEPDDFVPVGHLASAESIPTLVDINKLITRHSAIVGTTGAGKSTTVAGLLTSLSEPARYPSARIIVLDIHGEYAKTLEGRSTVFRIGADESKGERPLYIPFWALSFEELVTLAFSGLDGQKASTVADSVMALKKEALSNYQRDGVTADTVTVDSPVPFCIHKLWLELHKRENMTVIPKPGALAEEREPAYVLDGKNQPVQIGDAMSVTPPLYRTVKTTGPAAERVQYANEGVIGIRQQVAGLASKLRDPRFAFLFNSGDWLPDLDGTTEKDLDSLLQDWIGGSQPITILDLSGIPSSVLNDLIGAMLRILYDALFWARKLPEGGRERPLLIVLEEAHTYLGENNSSAAGGAVRRIAKEGRKYGVGLMAVSQRPAEIDQTILSQCGTIFAMRLANDTDRGHVTGAASDNLKGLFEMLPILRTGEAIIVGEAVSLPVRTLIEPPPKNRRPDSVDPRVAVRGNIQKDGFESPGGWNQKRDKPDYAAVVRQWRKQSPHYEHKPPGSTQIVGTKKKGSKK